VERIRALEIPALHVGVSLYAVYSEFAHGHLDAALALCDELLALAGDDASLGAGLAVGCPVGWLHMMRANVCLGLGRLQEGVDAWTTGSRMVVESGDRETESWLGLNTVWRAWVTGETARVAEHGARALELAEANGSAFSRVWALSYYSMAMLLDGRPGVAVEYAQRALALARGERSGLEGESFHLTMLADALLGAGDAVGAEAAAREALAIAEQRETYGAGAGTPETLARALIELGRHDEAAEVLALGFERVRAFGIAGFEPRLWIVRADLAAATGDPAAEADALARARSLFASQGADRRAADADGRLSALTV
jgi:tetratricopeptide (TPR) repeat protein